MDYIKHVLPIKKPWISCYTTYSHLLAILQCDEKTFEWILSNFINVFMNKDLKNNSWGEFYHPMQYELTFFDVCKWIDVQKIRRNTVVDTREHLLDFVTGEVQNGYYVHLNIDHRYITSFDTNKHAHDAMVYGIDLCNNIVYVLDVFKKGRYENKELKVDEFLDAVLNCNIPSKEDYMKGLICSYKIDENCDYEYNEENIWNMYYDYLNASIPEYWGKYNNSNKNEVVFGIDVYQTLKKYIDEIQNGQYIDVRPFYLLKDHIVMMSIVLEWLKENGDRKKFSYEAVIEIYHCLLDKIEEINFNLIFMNKTRKDKKAVIIEKINEMYTLEKSIRDYINF